MNLYKHSSHALLLGIILASSLAMLNVASATSSSKTEAPTETQQENIIQPHSTESVRVTGRQLIVNGKPFIMKGICYNPVPKGKNHPDGIIFLKPSLLDLITIEHDFKMMQDAGINTVRTYEPIVDSRVLSLLLKYHLRTIVPVCTNCKRGLYDFSSTIDTLKNHPSTLIWEIGNEWNNNLFYSTEFGWSGSKKTVLKYGECLTLIKDMSTYIRALDASHPIGVSFGDIPKGRHGELAALSKYVDLYGITFYDGLSFGDRLAYWKTLSDKPLYIDECGADSFNTFTFSYDSKDQAIADGSIIKEAFENLSAKDPNNVLVGLCIFEWSDEWWKCKNPKESLSAHTTGGFPGFAAGPYPDHYFNEEWFGILDIDRHPRPAYEILKQLYTGIL